MERAAALALACVGRAHVVLTLLGKKREATDGKRQQCQQHQPAASASGREGEWALFVLQQGGYLLLRSSPSSGSWQDFFFLLRAPAGAGPVRARASALRHSWRGFGVRRTRWLSTRLPPCTSAKGRNKMFSKQRLSTSCRRTWGASTSNPYPCATDAIGVVWSPPPPKPFIATSRGQIDDLRQGGTSGCSQACHRRARRDQPPHMGAMEHEQWHGGVGVWYKPLISG
jgi:hypothetical protein